MNPTAREYVPGIIRRLVEASRPERIILFGSHSRNEAQPDSDLDLLIIEAEPFGANRNRLREIARLERAMGRLPCATDLLVYSREEVAHWRRPKHWRRSPHHVVATALREREVVYARH